MISGKVENSKAPRTKVLFIGGNLSQNKGGCAIVLSCRNALKDLVPNAEFAFTSIIPKYDSKWAVNYGIRLVPEMSTNRIFYGLIQISRLVRCSLWNLSHRSFGLSISRLIDDEVLNDYMDSDIIIEVSGDGLSGDYGFFSTFFSLSRLLCCVMLKKRFVIYAQSIGPFKIKWPLIGAYSPVLSDFCKHIASYSLNNAVLITVREKITLDNLISLEIVKPPIHLTADSAFLLEPSPDHLVSKMLFKYGINKKEQLVGISVSESISRLRYNSNSPMDYDGYEYLIGRIIDYIVTEIGFKVVIVPHVTGPRVSNDDRIMGEKIFNKSNNKNNVVLISEDLGPEMLKGIIGRCELFIGSRMHACIAALSMRVPTVAIGYSHKTEGIMTDAGQRDYICDFNQLEYDDIIYKIENAWQNRALIRKELDCSVPKLEDRSKYNAFLVSDLL